MGVAGGISKVAGKLAGVGLGNAIEGAVEGSISAAGNIAASTIKAAGMAAQGMGNAMAAALKKPDVIINNVGMAGEGVTQTKTTPGKEPKAPTKVKGKYIPKNAPTRVLLNFAIDYLDNIADNLQKQLIADREKYRKDLVEDRESRLEAKKLNLPGVGSTLKKTVDTSKSLMKFALPAAMLTGLAAGKIGDLKTSALGDLKKNLDDFKNKFSWLPYVPLVIGGIAVALKLGKIPAVRNFVAKTGINLSSKAAGALEGVEARAVAKNATIKMYDISPKQKMILEKAGYKPSGIGWRSPSGKMATKGEVLALIEAIEYGGLGAFFKGGLRVAGSAPGIAVLSEAVMYALGLKDISARNLVGSIGAVIGMTGGALLGAPLGGVGGIALGAAGGVGGEYVGTSIYDKIFGAPDATPISASPVTPNAGDSFVPTGDKKVDAAMSYLMQNLGITKEQAAGIVGNIQAESRFDTNITNGIGAYGLAQWTDSRKDALKQFAKSRGKAPGDFETQLAFMVQELRTTHAKALKNLRTAKTPEEAARIFMNDYERPAEAEKASSFGHRVGVANIAAGVTKGDIATAQSDATYEAEGTQTSSVTLAKLGEAVKAMGPAAAKLMGSQQYVPLSDTRRNKPDFSKLFSEEQRKLEADLLKGRDQKRATKATTQNTYSSPTNDQLLYAIDPNYKLTDTIVEYLAHFHLTKAPTRATFA